MKDSNFGPVQENSSFEKKENIEREKKFLVKEIPEDLEQYEKEEIKQGYITEVEDETEIRVREITSDENVKWYQTIKKGEGEERKEIELEISEEQFDLIWETSTEGKQISKTRYKIPHNTAEGKELFIELDVFKGDLEGHVTAEIEGEKEDLKNLNLPKWVGEDVTESGIYSNKRLASDGLPKLEKHAANIKKEDLGIPEFDLKEGVDELVKSVQKKMAEKEGTIIVEIAGGSASGKTSAVATKLQDKLGDDALILSMDNYYRGGKYVKDEAEKGNIINFDQPEALNLDLLHKHLEQLKRGESIDELEFHFSDDPSEIVGKIEPRKVIIIEGLFAINDTLEDQGDIKAFVSIGTHGRVLRRMLRDVNRTGQKPEDILKYFSEIVEPMQEKHIDSTKKNADLIINNEYKPEIEASRAEMYEVQMKFKNNISSEELRKIGAERLGAINQIDKYYNPKDKDLSLSGESLRIRNEGEYRTLTYKGPKVESEFRKKPKFEFEIDKDTEKKFLSIYGDKTKTITKKRTMYQLDGIIINIDVVSKEENGEIEELGNFIELKMTDKGENKGNIEKVIEKLGLNIDNGIKDSYVEM